MNPLWGNLIGVWIVLMMLTFIGIWIWAWGRSHTPVSYTHLDVYKRQACRSTSS